MKSLKRKEIVSEMNPAVIGRWSTRTKVLREDLSLKVNRGAIGNVTLSPISVRRR